MDYGQCDVEGIAKGFGRHGSVVDKLLSQGNR